MQTKFSKIALLALLSVVGLTSCNNNEVVAKPSQYDDKLVNFEEEVYNNVQSIVYDAIRDGSLASDVLEDVLFEYANSIVGAYNSVSSTVEGTTLKEAYASVKGSDKTVANEFIDAHKAYHSLKEDGTHDREVEYAKVEAKWDTIEERIAERMHKEIASGSYSERNLFSEKDYLVNLYSGLNNVANPFTSEVTTTNEGKIISPDVEPKDVFKEGLLNRNYYQTNYDVNVADDENGYTYVEDAIIPKIYQELLVEQYLLDETYNTLGRSYAREVNIVSIKSNDEYPLAASYLVNYFVEEVINVEGKEVGLAELKQLSNAWKGVDLTSVEEEYLVKSKGFTTQTIGGETVYLGTEYGDLMEDYAKITDNPLTTDTSIESSFTNNNSYSKEVGLEIKSNEVALKDHTENGWYIKNGGLTNLPEAIRTRLFNIGVANALDNEETLDRFDANFKASEESPYIANINGACYLKVAETQGSETSATDILHYDADSKTYYIIQVVNATSTSKLSKESSNAYDTDVMEGIVNDVVRVVANNESYKTLATEHWLEEAGLEYHDTVVYDYFKENYPDLFN